MQLIDIGANLAHDSFDADREAVIQRAFGAGVAQIVVTGSDAASNAAAADLAAAHPGRLFATAGCHPHHAKDAGPALYRQQRDLAAQGAVVALGEMGLDFFRDLSPRPLQEQVFAAQLAVCAEAGLPAFLHQRDAHERFVPILREFRDRLPGAVVHCFTAGQRELYDYLDLGCHIGITGWLCDERRGASVFELAPEIPADRLMIETDAPYLLPRTLTPKPAGRRNEPGYLPEVLAVLARARGEDPAVTAAAATATTKGFFQLPAPPG